MSAGVAVADLCRRRKTITAPNSYQSSCKTKYAGTASGVVTLTTGTLTTGNPIILALTFDRCLQHETKKCSLTILYMAQPFAIVWSLIRWELVR